MTAEIAADAQPEPIADPLVGAVTELLDALETVTGLLGLGDEAVYVRDNLDKAARFITQAAGRGD